MTGVLIDLHWLRILGQQSKVLSSMTDLLGKSLGYLLDVILIPMIPHFVKLSMMVLNLATQISRLDKPWRGLVTIVGASVIGITVFATVLNIASGIVTSFSTVTTGATLSMGKFAAVVEALLAPLSILLALISFLAMRNVIKPAEHIKELTKTTEELSRRNKTGLLPPSEMFLPQVGFAEGGIATKPTAGIFGEAGAEAIIPLSKIGEVLGGLLGSGAGFMNTLTQAAGGALGAGAGGGLNMGGSQQGTMVKGFSWVAGSINEGFRINNELLAAILALLAQGGTGGGGLDPLKLAQDIWNAVVSAATAAWNTITGFARGVWDTILSLGKSVWDSIVNFATTIWTTIGDIAQNTWDTILGIGRGVWDSVKTFAENAWITIEGYGKIVWDKIESNLITLVSHILAIIPRPNEDTGGGVPTPDITPTGKGTPTIGGGTPPPIFEGLQKVFKDGVYIGDWELYSDGSKKWRPNPNIPEVAGTTSPPSGTSSASPGGTSGNTGINMSNYISEGADNYAHTVNTAMQEAAETTSNAVSDSTTSFTDVFVSAVTGVGNLVWDTLTDVGTAIYDTVTGAASAVMDVAGGAIAAVSNYLSNTPGFRSTTTSTAMTGGFTAGNALSALGLVGGGSTAADIASNVLSGAVSTIGEGFAHTLGIPGFQSGGTMSHTGLAFLHEGETVTPSGKSGGDIILNNPTFQISGRTDRELFENFMRMMKLEGARVH